MKYATRKKMQEAKLSAAFIRSWREDARVAQQSKCAYCRDPLTARTATADHVVPRAHYGKDERNNIVASCEPCNTLKGRISASSFKAMIQQPPRGAPFGFWLAWSRLRINRRLEKMERNLERFFDRGHSK